ncbi:phage tail protein [Campylobacter sp. US33a]|uniref:phage tail protein n=1 Tax=Campylobacter sp. US33a TaxID=2498120 RepID=UPI001FB940DF|nr:phage tail protein [Campylobacter sp. US33a]
MAKSEYYTILTKIGIAKFIAARASGNGVNLKSFKLSSKVILPSEEMENLEEIVYEANINSKYIDEKNPNYVNLECYVPSNVGGFEVNAVGIYNEEGDLIAVGNTPRTYKPLLEQGSAKELMIKVVMELSNAEEVILKLDPSVIMASRDYVDAIKLELELKIEAAIDDFNKKLAKKADLNGNKEQVFSVANPTDDKHAINKITLEKLLENINGNIDNLLKNCVLLNTDQTIKGNKTFEGNTAFKKAPTSEVKATKDKELVNLLTLKEQVPLLSSGLFSKVREVELVSNVIYTNSSDKPVMIIFNIKTKNLTPIMYYSGSKWSYQDGYNGNIEVNICIPTTTFRQIGAEAISRIEQFSTYHLIKANAINSETLKASGTVINANLIQQGTFFAIIPANCTYKISAGPTWAYDNNKNYRIELSAVEYIKAKIYE